MKIIRISHNVTLLRNNSGAIGCVHEHNAIGTKTSQANEIFLIDDEDNGEHISNNVGAGSEEELTVIRNNENIH